MRKVLVTELLYNGHLQSLGSVGVVLLTYYLAGIGVKFPFALALSTYCLFQPIYYFDRYKDFKKDSLTNQERSKHIKKYFRFIPFGIFFLSFLYIVTTLQQGSEYAFVFGILVLVAGLIYPIKAKNITKKIPLFKNLYVGGVHGLLVFYPFLFFSKTVTTIAFSVFIYVLLEAMISQIVLDTKDTKSDFRAKLKTLPALVGENKSFNVALLLCVLSIAFTTIFYFVSKINPSLLLIALITLFISLMSIHYSFQKNKIGYLLAASKFAFWITAAILF